MTGDATARAWSVLWGEATTDRGGCAMVPGRGARRRCSGARRCRRSAYLQRQAFLTHIGWSRLGATAAAVGMDGLHERAAAYATRNGGRMGSALEHRPISVTEGGCQCGTCNRTARGHDEGDLRVVDRADEGEAGGPTVVAAFCAHKRNEMCHVVRLWLHARQRRLRFVRLPSLCNSLL